ncbi:phytanoyl-CoA dioxygenase family protein [bacterium]|nr:phytanoyl-CoA dioxygenase family protein [bacterium]
MSASASPQASREAHPLTDQHLQRYRDDGYILVRQLLPIDALAAVRRRILEIVADPAAWPHTRFQFIDPQRYRHPNGLAIPGGIQRPALQEPVFDQVARHPILAAAMAKLLGGPVKPFTDQIGYRIGALQEDQGGRSYFHQDSYYWKLAPKLGCNAWLPLDPVDKDAGALPIMPGSHRDWTLREHEQYYDDPPIGTAQGHRGEEFRPFQRHRIPAAQINFSREVLHPMQPGDALFFTNYTWHRSAPNRTGQDQLYYAIAYERADQPSAR